MAACACGDSKLVHTVKRDDVETLGCSLCPCEGFTKPGGYVAKKATKSAYELALDAITPALVKRSGGRCEAALPGICRGRAARRHHRKRRPQGANDLFTVVHLCVPCHDWVHASGKGRSVGLLVRKNADPSTIPVDTTVVFGERGRVWQPS